ncbi:DUF5676 family membrane protein [Acaryochloris sp. CCMEE 5410]|uniref:DUF5676 family membrane protein n=1 Tax=Acaryochloris sp. CCMEE 5410 TaxID=310037 RepID=UPI0002483EF1|nr:DUF5676 family membrane protein [Acaryochloris sp. CCMEE 5410]KAI9130071.1 hypothetical protein ON05_031030 [Acaryochloris sp. CCMEE 5410]
MINSKKTNLHQKNHHRIHQQLPLLLNTQALFIATALITGMVYAVCYLFIVLKPQTTMQFFSYIFHLDLTRFDQVINWLSFCVGLLFWTFGTAFYVSLIAGLYNRLLSKSRMLTFRKVSGPRITKK